MEDPYLVHRPADDAEVHRQCCGGRFFLPDSSQFYFAEFKGEKYLRYVPNANHSLGGTDALESIMAFYHAILTKQPRPHFSWTFVDEERSASRRRKSR